MAPGSSFVTLTTMELEPTARRIARLRSPLRIAAPLTVMREPDSADGVTVMDETRLMTLAVYSKWDGSKPMRPSPPDLTSAPPPSVRDVSRTGRPARITLTA